MRKQWISRLVAFVMAMVLCLSVAAAALAAYDTIPYGEQSTAVRQMQDKLKAKGYYRGAVDGHFGPATKAAVIKFQKDVGITPDGRPGNVTLTALYSGKTAVNQAPNGERNYTTKPTNPHTLYYGCTGYRVKTLQSALQVSAPEGPVCGWHGGHQHPCQPEKAHQHQCWIKLPAGQGQQGPRGGRYDELPALQGLYV